MHVTATLEVAHLTSFASQRCSSQAACAAHKLLVGTHQRTLIGWCRRDPIGGRHGALPCAACRTQQSTSTITHTAMPFQAAAASLPQQEPEVVGPAASAADEVALDQTARPGHQ